MSGTKRDTTRLGHHLKLPDSLRLLGIETPIIKHDKKTFEEGSDDLVGLWRSKERQIEIATQHRPEYVADTFLHELLHAAVEDSNYPIEAAQHEQLVSSISKILLSYFNDNPQILEYFLYVSKQSKKKDGQHTSRRRNTKRTR